VFNRAADTTNRDRMNTGQARAAKSRFVAASELLAKISRLAESELRAKTRMIPTQSKEPPHTASNPRMQSI
jgi:hypothetical protein